MRQIPQLTTENLDGLLNDMKNFKQFRDSVESGLHRMEEAILPTPT